MAILVLDAIASPSLSEARPVGRAPVPHQPDDSPFPRPWTVEMIGQLADYAADAPDEDQSAMLRDLIDVARLAAQLKAERSSPSSEAERTLHSIVTMLGWENIPPRETLECEIALLKRLANDGRERSSPSGLAEKLITYRAQHSFTCAATVDMRFENPGPCTCGLDALLKSAEGTK